MMFFLRLPSRNILQGFDLMSDVMLHPLLKPEAIHKERTSVIEEINEDLDDYPSIAEELFDSILFTNRSASDELVRHPLTLPNIGNKDRLANIHASHVERCWKRIINPKNLVITVVGNFPVDKMKRRISQAFSHLRPRFTLPGHPFHDTQSEYHLGLVTRQTEQIYFQLGFPTFGWADKRYYAMAVLNNVLGGKPSSRLYQLMRGRKGIVYFIGSDIWHYADIGFLHITTSCSPGNSPQLLDYIFEELRKLKTEKISTDELHETQSHLKGHATIMFEEALHAGKFYTGQLLRLNTIIPVNTYKQRIDTVTRTDVQKLANQILHTKKINLAMVGPVDDSLKSEIKAKLVL
jgi:predicted Zn-dependent peptidase